MPQTFYALQCAECSTFQVVQRSAQTKFCCKLCGLKQSITRVYGSGAAKDVRAIVQQLNMARAVGDSGYQPSGYQSNDHQPNEYLEHGQFGWDGGQTYSDQHHEPAPQQPQPQHAQPQPSRWAQYLPPQAPRAAVVDEVDDGDDDPRFVTALDRGGKRKRAADQENLASNRGGRGGGRGRGRGGGTLYTNASGDGDHPSLSATAACGGGGGDSYAVRAAPPAPAAPVPPRGRVACAANEEDDGFFCGSFDVAYEEEVWE